MTDIPPFTVEGLTFECHVVADRYEWRSTDGRCRVGRNTGNAMAWATCDGRELGRHYQGLKAAMQATAKCVQRQQRAA